MDTLLADLRYALRTLRKSPGFAAAAILTLALAIGSNTAVFSVVNGVLLRPLPFAGQDRLFVLGEQSRQGGFRPPSYPTFLDWQAQSSAVVDLAYVRGGGQRLTGPEGVQSIIVSVVSPGFFATLGERPLVGRLFTPDEERVGAHVAVLSYALWQGRFGGDPHILGRTLSLSGGVSTVVGVLPHDVAYPPWTSEQLYVPIATVAATERALTQRGFHADCRIIGRLKPGVTLEQATAGMNGIARREAAAYPEFNADWISVRFFPLRDEILGETTPRQLLVLLTAVGLVLLIGCVNVANLTLARAGARSRELAIRSALGAGRGRVVRQLLTESLVLASVGAALGAVTAYGAVALLKRAAPDVLPRLETVRVDGWVLLFALGVTIITAVAAGLFPALRAARPDLTDSLKEGTAGTGTGHRRQRLRAALVIGEIALAVILVVGAGLLIRSLWQLAAVNPGFDPQGLVSFWISPPPLRAQDPARLAALYTQVEDAARALPGVTSVALTNFTPLSGGGLPSPVEIPGRAPDPVRDPRVWFMTVSPDYFRTMRIPIRAGREFTEADLAPDAAVVVNEAFARAFWPGLDPIGRQVTLHKAVQGRPDFGEPLPGTVVGVVGDVHHFGLDTPAEPQVYVPFTRTVWGHMSLVVRTAVAPA
ncbi:MAG TPA: ABC transporter permease, partial [Gemmatimonadales bacterium]|nr:ABC transporter permease [Gemmatimonadales bacterium]